MRVLFLMPQTPYPPQQGTAIRNWGLLNGVSHHHQTALLAFGTPPPHPTLAATCEQITLIPPPTRTRWQRLLAFFTNPAADLALRLKSPAFSAALAQTLATFQPHVVQIEGLELGRYLPEIRRLAPHTHSVFDAHNAEVMIQQRAYQTDRQNITRWPAALYSQAQAGRIAKFEQTIVQMADAVLAVSPEDATLLAQLRNDLVHLVPNGLTLSEYASPPPPPPNFSPHAVVFTGKMDYRPNSDAVTWFVAEIWPQIRAACPTATFYIVGQQPTAAVQALAQQGGVVVTGAVPNVHPYLAHAAVYVAPLRMGGGTRFKLLEAMALNRAIVSTTLGAEGFAITPNQELILADDPPNFAQSVIDLLNHPSRRAELGAAGQAFVAKSYDWAAILPTLLSAYPTTLP